MSQDCKKVRTITAEFEQHYVSLDIPLDAGAVDPAAPDCGQCWMLLVILCPSSALLSLFLYFLCSHMGRTSCALCHWKSFCTSFDCVLSFILTQFLFQFVPENPLASLRKPGL